MCVHGLPWLLQGAFVVVYMRFHGHFTMLLIMVLSWFFRDLYMVVQWHLVALNSGFMDFSPGCFCSWCFHDMFTWFDAVLPWRFYDASMVSPRSFHECLNRLPSCVHGDFKRLLDVFMVLSWCFLGTFMESHGTCMAHPWCLHGVFVMLSGCF